MEIGSIQDMLGGRMAGIAATRQQTELDALEREGAPAKVVGKHFEAMLATMLARELRSGLDEGFFGSGPGADTFSAWLDEHIGRVMAERGVLGVANLVDEYAAGVAAQGPSEPGADSGGEPGAGGEA